MVNVQLFEEIVTGWSNLLFRRDEIAEEEAKKRLEHCVDCQHLRKNKTCNLCNCYMPAKTRSPKSHCPIKLW